MVCGTVIYPYAFRARRIPVGTPIVPRKNTGINGALAGSARGARENPLTWAYSRLQRSAECMLARISLSQAYLESALLFSP
jgi:hypothetical protein